MGITTKIGNDCNVIMLRSSNVEKDYLSLVIRVNGDCTIQVHDSMNTIPSTPMFTTLDLIELANNIIKLTNNSIEN